MIGALLFGLTVAAFFGAGFAAVWRWTADPTPADPRCAVADDDDTARIEPTTVHDLPRRTTRSWTL